MTIVDNYFPFDTGPGSTATAARWRLMARLWFGSGIVQGFLNGFAPSIAGSVVTIQTGAVWIDGYYGESDSPKTVGITGNGMVVIRMDPVARQIILIFVLGQNVPTQNQNGIYEIPLMQVTGATGVDIRQYGSPSPNPIPSGTIFDYGGATLPAGWLACNGTTVSRTTYAALFAAIGTTWGTGDGSTTFTLPDLRNKFAIGAGTLLAVGKSGGSQSITTANMPAHNHGVSDPQHSHALDNPNFVVIETFSPSTLGLTATGDDKATYHSGPTGPSATGVTIQNTGSGSPYLPPAAAVQKMIKT